MIAEKFNQELRDDHALDYSQNIMETIRKPFVVLDSNLRLMGGQPRILLFVPKKQTRVSMETETTIVEQKRVLDGDLIAMEIVTEVRRAEALLKAGALQNAIFTSADFSSIATDERGVIQIFNVGG